MAADRTIQLPSGEVIPVLGLGTWRMAEDARRRADEVDAIRYGLDLGMSLVDTAEMYADGAAEELVGEAIAGRRDEVFLVSKLLPTHATPRQTIDACEGSLKRLRTDRIDLYLLHWRGPTPLERTLEGFASLVEAGKIRYWGVSNFDTSDMEELVEIPGSEGVQTDQVLYNLTRRGIEYDLLPWCRARRVAVMAYSPLEQGRLLRNAVLEHMADAHRVTVAQLALAWVIHHEGVCAIPKAATRSHVRQNHGALDIRFTKRELEALDTALPPPKSKLPLEML